MITATAGSGSARSGVPVYVHVYQNNASMHDRHDELTYNVHESANQSSSSGKIAVGYCAGNNRMNPEKCRDNILQSAKNRRKVTGQEQEGQEFILCHYIKNKSLVIQIVR
jgi:hypothetical protein